MAVAWALSSRLSGSAGGAVGSVRAAPGPLPAALGGKGMPVASWASGSASWRSLTRLFQIFCGGCDG